LNVFRWHQNEKGLVPEMWKDGEWKWFPKLIDASGLGWGYVFIETTKAEAIAFIKAHTYMYSVKEASGKIGVSERQLRHLLAKGEIEGKRLGHDWVVLNLDYERQRRPKGSRQKSRANTQSKISTSEVIK
jgi:hypothetical protein